MLIVGGPLRAAWQRIDEAPTTRWAAQFPKVFALTFILSVFTFFTMCANPFAHVLAAGRQPEVQSAFETALGVAGCLLQPVLLMGLLLLALRRWLLPFGSLTRWDERWRIASSKNQLAEDIVDNIAGIERLGLP